MQSPSPKRDAVNGWLVLDKPAGITSTTALGVAKRLLNAAKGGHSGTLDPIATGVLPLAFGTATKTVPWVVDGEKAYSFAVRFGAETDTDDVTGTVLRTATSLPDDCQIRALLPSFRGEILQRPPDYSAIKRGGERAYDRARAGLEVELEPRPVHVKAFDLARRLQADEVEFAVVCGRGTYMRSLARDLGRALGCFGHMTALRRTRVSFFREADAVSLESLRALADLAARRGALLPVAAGLERLPRLPLTRGQALSLADGKPINLADSDTAERLKLPDVQGEVVQFEAGSQFAAFFEETLIAVAALDGAEIVPRKVFASLRTTLRTRGEEEANASQEQI